MLTHPLLNSRAPAGPCTRKRKTSGPSLITCFLLLLSFPNKRALATGLIGSSYGPTYLLTHSYICLKGST